MDQLEPILILSLERASNRAMKKEIHGTLSLELFLQVMRSAELTLVVSTYALCLRSIHFSVSRMMRLNSCFGSIS